MSSAMIRAENLGRYFGGIKAVDGVSFEVRKGDVLGFLGPNGAGKSTTMKLITGFLTPSFGNAVICGFDVVAQSKEVRKLIGYLPENAPLYGEMTVEDFLHFIAEIREIPREKQKEALDRIVALTSLSGVFGQKIETLSKGYKRRVGLAQALIHDPEVLILDEPTDGLDPNQKFEVRALIHKMAKEKCIILSTHILEEVDEVCNRVVIIAKGKIVADSTPEDLRKKSKFAGAIKLQIKSTGSADILPKLKLVPGINEVIQHESGAGAVSFTLLPKQGVQALFAVLKEAELQHWNFESLSVEAGEMDEVFRSITQ